MQGHNLTGRGLSRDGDLQGTWPLSSSEEGIGARSQQDTQDPWVSHREPKVSLQPCHQPAPAPGGVSHPQLMRWGSGQSRAGFCWG